jgi:hypothetical protein
MGGPFHSLACFCFGNRGGAFTAGRGCAVGCRACLDGGVPRLRLVRRRGQQEQA